MPEENEPLSGEFLYQTDDDGNVRALPSDHMERVQALCTQLMTSPTNHQGARAILATRFDGKLTEEYGTLVAMAAIELLCKWMIHEATPFTSTLLCRELPRLILAARTDRRGKMVADAKGATPVDDK